MMHSTIINITGANFCFCFSWRKLANSSALKHNNEQVCQARFAYLSSKFFWVQCTHLTFSIRTHCSQKIRTASINYYNTL